jgi:FdhE protein
MSARADGVPLLHGTTLTADGAEVRSLLAELATEVGADVAGRLIAALQHGRMEAIEIIQAAIRYDEERLDQWTLEAEIDTGILGVVAQMTALPLLLACGQRFDSQVTTMAWSKGYCPVCGGWPTLAEMRGLERQQWLRCGRCASSWEHGLGACVFCGEDDHEQLGYLAPERERESRRAVTCESCHGYLKTFATLAALSAADIVARDLSSVELDVAALDEGYQRPSEAGYRPNVRLEPTRRRWRGWRS